MMLKNYFKVALRNLIKQKGYATINMLGLATGLTCFILIGLYVHQELRFDRFHEKADRIFRIANEMPGIEYLGSNRWANTPAPVVNALVEDIPEVEYATQITKAQSLIESDDNQFYEDGIFATEDFFNVFTFPLLQGDPETALADPHSIVITKSLAQKYFGASDPMGQVLTVSYLGEFFSGVNEMKVTGIVEDVPSTSHFTFDYIVPVQSCRELTNYITRWDSNSYLTYAALQPGYSLPDFSQKLKALSFKYLSQLQEDQTNPKEVNIYFPQPLIDIHLYSNLNAEFGANGNIRYVYLFSAIAALILFIACINYVNLSIARSTVRATEIGVRKTMGAYREQLVGQFMSEAIMPSFMALMISLVLVELMLPAFNALTGHEITRIYNNGFILILLAIGFGVGILAGIYPAMIMSGFRPVSMMKGKMSSISTKSRFRNILVVVQFVISITLIISVIVIQRQLDYIKNAETGVARDQVIGLPIQDRTLYERFQVLKQTLLSHPNIQFVTAAQSNPIDINSASLIKDWEGAEAGQSIMVYRSVIRYDYLKLFDLELIEGRDFSEANPGDAETGVIINETAMRQLGWETAVGKACPFRDRTHVIGVVKDFTFLSYHHDMAPLAFTLESGWWFPYQRVFIKAGAGNIRETVDFLKTTMTEFSPDYPFEYYFLDDDYNKMYQTETKLGQLMLYFTILAIFISCLGLLGIASFLARQRTKEIGIRKVFGASVADILALFSKDFTWLVLIALLIASPIAFYLASQWLESFAYRITIRWVPFVSTGVIVLILATVTVSYQSLRAALINPVDSLRHE